MPVAQLAIPSTTPIGLSYVCDFPDSGGYGSLVANDDYYFGPWTLDNLGDVNSTPFYRINLIPSPSIDFVGQAQPLNTIPGFWTYQGQKTPVPTDRFDIVGLPQFPNNTTFGYPDTSFYCGDFIDGGGHYVYSLSDPTDNSLVANVWGGAGIDGGGIVVTYAGYLFDMGPATFTDKSGTYPAFGYLFVQADWSTYYRLIITPQIININTSARDPRALAAFNAAIAGQSIIGILTMGKSGWWFSIGQTGDNSPFSPLMLGSGFPAGKGGAGSMPGIVGSGFTPGGSGLPLLANPNYAAIVRQSTQPRAVNLGAPRYTVGNPCRPCQITAAGIR